MVSFFFLMIKKIFYALQKMKSASSGVYSHWSYTYLKQDAYCVLVNTSAGQFVAVMSATFRTTRCPGVALTESSVIPKKRKVTTK